VIGVALFLTLGLSAYLAPAIRRRTYKDRTNVR